MPDLITRLKLSNEEFNSNIESSKRAVGDFQKTADNTKKTLNELGDKGSKSARELLTEMNNLNNSGRGATNYRRQLKEIQNTLNDLTISYRQMSDEMKASPIGQEVAGKIQELTAQAAQYKDAINDVQQEIQRMSSDTAVWDGMKMGIQTVSASLQAFVAAGVLGEEQTEKLVAVIARLKAIEAITNAVIRIGNALQKDQAVIAGISTIQHKLLTRAKQAETAATVKATIAQKAMNKVANANPYVLLAAALIAVGTALYAFTKNSEKARIEQEKQNTLVQKAEDNFTEYKNSISKAVGDVEGKFMLLKRSYEGLRTEFEKKKFIEDNADAFETLGLKIQDTNDANKIFIEQAPEVINALRAKARAAALASLYQEKYTKQVEAEIEAEKLLADARNKEIQKKGAAEGLLMQQDWKDAGLSIKNGDIATKNKKVIGQGGMLNDIPVYELTPQGEQKMRDYYEDLARQAGQELIDQAKTDISTVEQLWLDAENQAAQAASNVSGLLTNGKKGGGGGNDKKKAKEEEIFDPNSLKAANEQVAALKKQLESMNPDDINFQNVLTQLHAWENIQKHLNELLEETEEEVKEITDPKLDAWTKLSKQASELNLSLDIGAINPAEAQKQVAELNKNLEAAGLTVRYYVDLDENSIKRVKAEVEEIGISLNKAAGEMVGSTGRMIGSFNSVYESVKNLNETIDESKNGWEAFFKVFETGMTILEAITNVIQAITTMSQLLTTITEANTAAKTKNIAATTSEAAAASADATAQASDSGATMTNAAAHGAAAAAKSGESAASIPVVGWVVAPLAIAAVLAAVIAAIGALSAFADGGVVGGHSYYGDKVLARVNSQELILNTKQQERLWGLMNSGGGTTVSGNVEFKIKGSDLYGALNNYTKKMDKV